MVGFVFSSRPFWLSFLLSLRARSKILGKVTQARAWHRAIAVGFYCSLLEAQRTLYIFLSQRRTNHKQGKQYFLLEYISLYLQKHLELE